MAREVEPQRVRVGLAGCGVVGGALVRLLDESAESIESRYGLRFELSRVLVRDAGRNRGLPVPTSLFTSDRREFLAHETDIVVEAIGGCDAASEIARTSLARGRRFITANKELIASEGAELASLALAKSTNLDFGASVGGSAPVISLLRDLLGNSTPLAVRGILNGTSNYVLTLVERGASLDEAIDGARSRGLAEADCTRDLDGSDVAAKLAIVVWMSFGIAPSAVTIARRGITSRIPALIEAARVLGGKVRLVGQCETVGRRGVTASVEPVVFSDDHAFARTELEDNRIEVDMGWTSPLTVSGPGAGGAPTATALLCDLLNFAPRARERLQFAPAFECVEDSRIHRWLVASGEGWRVFKATRRELRERIPSLDRNDPDVATARLELPVVSPELS